jgi:hypothetical protein
MPNGRRKRRNIERDFGKKKEKPQRSSTVLREKYKLNDERDCVLHYTVLATVAFPMDTRTTAKVERIKAEYWAVKQSWYTWCLENNITLFYDESMVDVMMYQDLRLITAYLRPEQKTFWTLKWGEINKRHVMGHDL